MYGWERRRYSTFLFLRILCSSLSVLSHCSSNVAEKSQSQYCTLKSGLGALIKKRLSYCWRASREMWSLNTFITVVVCLSKLLLHDPYSGLPDVEKFNGLFAVFLHQSSVLQRFWIWGFCLVGFGWLFSLFLYSSVFCFFFFSLSSLTRWFIGNSQTCVPSLRNRWNFRGRRLSFCWFHCKTWKPHCNICCNDYGINAI